MSTQQSYTELKKLLPRISIAHHIKGRIRLKMDITVSEFQKGDWQPAKDFQTVLDALPGIREVKVNLLAKSCTVQYDEQVIPFEGWPDFITQQDTPAARALEAIVETGYREVFDA